MKRKAFLIFAFLIIYVNSYSQKTYGVDASFKHGFLMVHRSTMSHLPQEHVQACEVSIFKRMQNFKEWHKTFHYPEVGAALLYSESGNTPVLGRFYGAFAFLRLRFFEHKKSGFYVKLGSGLGYSSKVFNQENNPKNNAISSHVNALIQFSFLYQYRFQKNRLGFGLDMTHFSNGATTLPNLGLNYAYFTVHVGRYLEQEIKHKDFTHFDSNPNEKQWNYSIIAIGSTEDTYPLGNKKKPLLALRASAQKSFKPGVGFESGMDWMYKPSVDSYKPFTTKNPETTIMMGLYASYFAQLNRLQIHLGMGTYLRDEYDWEGMLYHRMGFKYVFPKGLLLNLTLKSHWAKADYVEYGIGYQF